MVVKTEIEELGALHQLPGEPKILAGRRRVPGGVVMDEDEGGRSHPKRRAENLARVHEGGGLGARRHEGVHQVVILGVHKDDPEVFFIVVSRPEEVSSE